MLINTIKDWKYTQVDDRALTNSGCIVDVGCSGWDWCEFFIGKKRVIGVDPYESKRDGVDFFEGLIGPINGQSRVIRKGAHSLAVGEMDLEDDSTVLFPMLNWKTFCKKFNIDRVSVLKLNIEGGEYALLNSLDTDDFKKIDQIVVSFHDFENPKFKDLTDGSVELLKKSGFTVQQIEPKWGWYLAIKTTPEPEPIQILDEPLKIKTTMNKSKTTIVTGLWDLGRGNLTGWAKRDFQQYKNKFFELLKADVNLAIWIPKELEEEVWKIRSKEKNNTQIYFKELKDFETWFPFFKELQKIRNNEAWKNSAGWLAESPQAALEYYNPMMMCKMFMVNDTAILNPFNSKYFYWMDGGLTNTVNSGYFTHDGVLDKICEYTEYHKKFTFISYPYDGNDEIHGFERKAMAQYCNTDFVKYVARGGFWGGKKDMVHRMNDEYYGVLKDTLTKGLMGADECLFTILCHRLPKEIQRFEIEGNGLVWPFFEMIKNFKVPEATDVVLYKEGDVDGKIAYIQSKEEIEMNRKGDGINLYVVTFNSPPQLQILLDTIQESNPELLSKTAKYLINNSIDRSTDAGYDAIAAKYGFTQIKEGNLGVCGARSWAAKHFHDSNAKYIVWFEDDMLMEKTQRLCKNGLNMHCDNWMEKCIEIVENENLDFVKISFTEFYGDHHEQWAWYNIPMDLKQKYFPTGEHRLTVEQTGCYKGLSYLIGEVYYSNWPSVMTKAGNYKIFLETEYAHPFEQTIMSHAFQLTKKGRMRSAVLMASLVNHHRTYHYSKEIRKEC
jgi:hypothetical protein